MTRLFSPESSTLIQTLADLAQQADFSLLNRLKCDPQARPDGIDHSPRPVCSGHYVPVRPTPIEQPEYVTHSQSLFAELGLDDALAQSTDFMRFFSADLSHAPHPLRKLGWASGYALSINGTEYTQQCPFQTGDGYGDGRAISVLEGVFKGRRWEMQLKGGGQTPYCRGADGRAVLRSSVREFLGQESMHHLGVPTARSLCLYRSASEQVRRPWYAPGSTAQDPDQLILEPVAITTRVAPSFIRVGQLELFGRRARNQAHPLALEELEQLVRHLIEREYAQEIDRTQGFEQQLLTLAQAFCERLTSLVSNWIRVGYCQGNFNSDNCAVGGFTLDYGPYGFCEIFDPYFQPWTGGGHHFAFFNQPLAAEKNFQMFCRALQPLLAQDSKSQLQLASVQAGFQTMMHRKLAQMWAAKLGLEHSEPGLLQSLFALMAQAPVDYTRFFRCLSSLPKDVGVLQPSFYPGFGGLADKPKIDQRWSDWFDAWKALIKARQSVCSASQIRSQMQAINPKYILREWQVLPVYQQASQGDYAPLKALQSVMMQPYAEQSDEISQAYDQRRPPAWYRAGGVSHYSCSS